jgi:hypothetical protein
MPKLQIREFPHRKYFFENVSMLAGAICNLDCGKSKRIFSDAVDLRNASGTAIMEEKHGTQRSRYQSSVRE